MLSKRSVFFMAKKLNKAYWGILLNAILICLLSFSAIYSATITKLDNFLKKELIWCGIGIFFYICFAFFDYKKYSKYYKVIYTFNILILLSVLFFGTSRLGAKRWIDLKFILVQPAEFSKILITITFSAFLKIHYDEKFVGFKSFFHSLIHVLPVFLLILIQPDLGTALIIIVIFATLIFINNLDRKTIITLVIATILSLPIAYRFLLKDYQRTRILTFLNPEADLLGSGWNVSQSMIAIGSGGMYGKGFLQSTQSKLKFLPESHTDFIASVFLEERGFFGGVIFVILYCFLIYQIIYIADTTKDTFGKLICYGIATIFFFHFFINMGMIMGIMPVTGLPLLMVSYGGSSLVFSFMMLGIVQSVKMHRGI